MHSGNRAAHKVRISGSLSVLGRDKLSIRFHHILPRQLHQENDSGRGINYACPWPKPRRGANGEGTYEEARGSSVRLTAEKVHTFNNLAPDTVSCMNINNSEEPEVRGWLCERKGLGIKETPGNGTLVLLPKETSLHFPPETNTNQEFY